MNDDKSTNCRTTLNLTFSFVQKLCRHVICQFVCVERDIILRGEVLEIEDSWTGDGQLGTPSQGLCLAGYRMDYDTILVVITFIIIAILIFILIIFIISSHHQQAFVCQRDGL